MMKEAYPRVLSYDQRFKLTATAGRLPNKAMRPTRTSVASPTTPRAAHGPVTPPEENGRGRDGAQ
jgi:hypothetical protein